jgi:hypothetical protein
MSKKRISVKTMKTMQGANDEGPNDQRPYLAIPYWSASQVPGLGEDNGSVRPLTNSTLTANKVISYLCPGIRSSPYTPGSDLTAEVDITNAGGGNTTSLAVVTVWWDIPGTVFGQLSASNMIGARLVAVPPRGGKSTTALMTKTIPVTAPDHICLLARVSHPLDVAGPLPDPVNDRHWAQRNLVSTTVADGGPAEITFWVGNPFEREAAFSVRARAVLENDLQQLARAIRREPILSADAKLQIYDARQRGNRETEPTREVRQNVTLAGGERRPLQFRVTNGGRVGAGQFAAYEIFQYGGHENRLLGSVGIVIEGAEG